MTDYTPIAISTADALPSGYTIKYTPPPSKTGIPRVYYRSDHPTTTYTELDRVVDGTSVYFATLNPVNSNTHNTDYYATFCPDSAAGTPLSNKGNVFLAFDDFNDNSAGDWAHGETFPTTTGKFNINGGKMEMWVESDERGTAHPGDPVAIYKGAGAGSWTDYTLEVDWYDLNDAGSADYPGPIVRIKNEAPSDYTAWWIEYHTTQTQDSVSCMRASIGNTDEGWNHVYDGPVAGGLKDNAWHHTTVKVVGDKFWHKFTDDGTTHVANDATQVTSLESQADRGTIGLTSHSGYGGSHLYWDNVKVMKAVANDPTIS
jgi:hypothetical protein